MPAWSLALLVLLAACQPPDPAPLDAGPPLLGTEWRLVAIDGDSVADGPLVTLVFSDRPWDLIEPGWRSLGGYDGCNDFGVGYRLDGDRVEVGGGILANAMACGPPRGHVSDSLNQGLVAARRLRIEGDRLVLSDSLGAERLAFVPRPVRPVDSLAVVSGSWRLDPAASTGTDPSGGSAGRYEVAFMPDGTYEGRADCVTFTGEYALAGDRLRVSSFVRDDQGCAPTDRPWAGPGGLGTGELEANDTRLVIYSRTGARAVFVRP